jgi:allantoicase
MNDFTQLADLASERLGGRVVEANDEFFAPKGNLLKESKPIFVEGKYTTRGKWMDGWETRRRRTPGHDWCIVRLGLPGIIRGIVVDTSFFTGNFPERFSLEGCNLPGRSPYENEKKKLRSATTEWVQLFPETPLKGDSRNLFALSSEFRFTHLRLRIFPDGGVARLRVHGEAVPDARSKAPKEIDLVSVRNGGSAVLSSDQFYGAPRNLLMPYRARNMGDGWETKRRRGPGHDWVILKLGIPGVICRIEVDTAHFKGNFPDSCSLEACAAGNSPVNFTNASSLSWEEVLPAAKLKANHLHIFKNVQHRGLATHVRFKIYPDGGVSRLRIFGRPETSPVSATGIERFNRMPRKQAIKALMDCCGSRKWVERVAGLRPFAASSDLFRAADENWIALKPHDWLEAFRHHPPIGGKRAKVKRSVTSTGWSLKEQSASQTAPLDVLEALALENQVYANKFGYVFLVCATGKDGAGILHDIRRRMTNAPEVELRIAAEEQQKITRLRLERLLGL